MRTDEEILAIIKGAFRPLRCDAEIWDYRDKIRFRVLGPDDKSLVSHPELTMETARSDKLLSGIIRDARDRIEARGIALDPWTPPGS